MSFERSREVAYWNNKKLSWSGRGTLVCSAPGSQSARKVLRASFSFPTPQTKLVPESCFSNKSSAWAQLLPLLPLMQCRTISAGVSLLPQNQCLSAVPPLKAVRPVRHSSLKSSAGALLLLQRQCRSVAPSTKAMPDGHFLLKSCTGASLLPHTQRLSAATPLKAVPERYSSFKGSAGASFFIQERCRGRTIIAWLNEIIFFITGTCRK